ncbi:nucleotidyltransferase [Vallitaleaceae bacterium 9-2]
MKIAAIISEYNPFHNGHAYQIRSTKETLGVDFVVAIMSGNYVQRGEPAIFDKWTRTRLALLGGVDVVIELPTLYSTASAELFAKGAVDLLNQLNIIDYLSFGSEHGDINPLTTLAQLYLNESPHFQHHLKANLKKGFSFPKARSLATSTLYPEYETLLKGSNNILAIEYLKALLQSDSSIAPFTLKRVGSSYLETKLQSTYASATAIRLALKDNPNAVDATIPLPCFDYLLDALGHSVFSIYPEDYFPYYRYLLTINNPSVENIYDFPVELNNRLQKIMLQSENYAHFIDAAQSKNYTKTTIQRALLHQFLNITTTNIQENNTQLHHYIKILGFKKSASPVLALLKNNARLPLITNVADHQKQLLADGKKMLHDEVKFTNLYNELLLQKSNHIKKNDYSQPIIIL